MLLLAAASLRDDEGADGDAATEFTPPSLLATLPPPRRRY